MEPVSAPVKEEAPIAASQESPVRQHPAEDDEEPMEQEESNPVKQEESDPVPQVRWSHSKYNVINDLDLPICTSMLDTYGSLTYTG